MNMPMNPNMLAPPITPIIVMIGLILVLDCTILAKRMLSIVLIIKSP